MSLECAICACKENVEKVKAREMYIGLRDMHDYFKCIKCGCLQIVQIPENIHKYYEGDYYSYKTIGRGNKLAQKAFACRNEFALRRRGWLGRVLFYIKPTTEFDFLRPLINSLGTDARILDVGCGSGTLLRSLKGLGYSRLKGIDPFIEASFQFGDGCFIEKKDIQAESGEFDLLMMHHSLEHMPNQFEALSSARKLLSNKGVCVIRIPLSSSYAWERYRENWAQLDAPRHFYLHSVDSMNHLANQSGFNIVDIRYDSSAFQIWGSEQYLMNIALTEPKSYAKNKKNPMFSKAKIEAFELLTRELNATGKGDQAIFYLQKA